MSIKNLKFKNVKIKTIISSFLLFFGIFFAAFSFSKLNIPTSSSLAKEQKVSVKVAPVLSFTLESSDTDLALGADYLYQTTNKAIVSTNNSTGYTLTISSNDNNTDLKHENPLISSKFTTLAANTLKQNLPATKWGLSLDDTTYQPIPQLASPTILKQTVTPASSEETKLYFAAKSDPTMLSGTYQKVLTLTAIANPNREPTFSGITTMQEMTSEICNGETTPHAFLNGQNGQPIVANTTREYSADKNLVPEAELTDTRDNKKYVIRKLADGNCWMVQNLDLGNTGQSLNLTPSDTDIASNFTLNNIGNPGASWSTNNNSNQVAVIDNGNKWLTNVSSGNNETVSTSEPSNSEEKLRHIGNYYSWYAATAGSGNYNMSSGNASNSICPKGWRLPFGENTNTNKSFQRLTDTYKITNDGSISDAAASYKLRSKPLSLPLSGRYWSTSVIYQGSSGYFWSSTVYSQDYARNLSLSTSVVYPQNYYNKMDGFGVRCVAR